MPIQSVNPSNGQLLRSFDPLSEQALQSKLALAAFAAARFPAEPLEQRILWMRRLAHLLESDAEELAATMTAEMGKTLISARQEVLKCASACRFYADHAAQILKPETFATEHAQSYVRWDPLGVILAVMPWNFPLWQVFRFLAPALMAGNVGLLKHASNVPQCAIAIEALVRRAGFPRGVFQTLLVEAQQVETILADDRVAAVTVTGSEAAGRAIAAQAGWLIKKTVLELGGSDPFIVLPSADLDAAVTNAVKARCINNGQSCIAAKRFIIHDSIYDEFERRFVEGMKALRIGDPTSEDTDLGPLATNSTLELLRSQVQAAVAAGGRLLTGGDRLGRPGNYFAPTVIAGVPPSTSVAREETFGPLALLFRADSIDAAIALANDTPFGLGASCWTDDTDEQARLSRDLACGGVFFNTPVASDPRLPFGGIKRSGYGRELSAAGMREFLNAKTVVVAAAADQPQQAKAKSTAPTAEEITVTVETIAPPPKPERQELPEPVLRQRGAPLEPIFARLDIPEPILIQRRDQSEAPSQRRGKSSDGRRSSSTLTLDLSN
jgi:succinate-semialdehyde dehydrogenase / glutarate-semialdehyde dehydrogenase